MTPITQMLQYFPIDDLEEIRTMRRTASYHHTGFERRGLLHWRTTNTNHSATGTRNRVRGALPMPVVAPVTAIV